MSSAAPLRRLLMTGVVLSLLLSPASRLWGEETPLQERVAGRDFPSVFQAWNPVENLPDEAPREREARHDLMFHAADYFGVHWDGETKGVATTFTPESVVAGMERRQELLSLNPKMVLLCEIRYRDAHRSFLPDDSEWWKRDERGEAIVGWEEGQYLLIDYSKPGFQTLVAKRAKAAIDSGVFDGILLDWWDEDEERIGLVRKIRETIGESALILVNANDRKSPGSAPYINGHFMECYRSDTAEDWAKISGSLKWAEKALREPRINCLETWFEESRRDLGRMRATTTLGLTHSDGYILFADPNPLPTPDHLHDWYPFWDFKLGKPLAEGETRGDGSTGREFENGYVVYNPPGQAVTVDFETPRRRVSNGRLAKTHVVEELDGDIFTKPRVLIIGDSISLGYTPFVRTALESDATVIHNQGNAGPTVRGVENIDEWLGDEEWDVIQFNFGLWDMYGWRYPENDLSPAAYEARLEALVLRLKETGASLIWAATTPACEDAEKKSAVVVDAATEKKYLEAAGRVMTRHGIPVNDLHAFMALRRDEFALGRNDVHYSEQGYRRMAQLVSGRIGLALAEASAAAEKE